MGEVFTMPKGQKARVKKFLQEFGSITPYDALKEFGIMRLSAIIFELRHFDDKLPIATKMEKSINRFGEPVQYARYVLLEESE